MSQGLGHIFGHAFGWDSLAVLVSVVFGLYDLADDDVIATDLGAWTDEAVDIKLVVSTMLELLGVLLVRLGDGLCVRTSVIVGSEED